MCTALAYRGKGRYFGRNLDLDHSYRETVTVTPRNFPLSFRKAPAMERHFALIGMAFVANDYPLYYDAVNEHGLGMAGLNFPKSAVYYEEREGRDNITPFEFIPWVLGQCADMAQVRTLLAQMNLWNSPFSQQLPLSPLHWIIADKEEAITVEATAEGMKIYDNPVGVLTNEPSFPFMMEYLTLFRGLSPELSVNRFSPEVALPVYCQGIGAMGLPGDHSSPSRFVRAAFTKLSSVAEEEDEVGQFFHLLGAVEMPRGSVRLGEGKQDVTLYSACCDQERGIYYYTTYDNRRITAVDMHRADLEGRGLISFDLRKGQDICWENR